MKLHTTLPVALQLLAIGALASFQAPPPIPAPAAPEIDLATFHDALQPYGRWTSLAPYGEVWIPAGTPAGWRPYTTGHWCFADEAGWTWVADEPWGWAPFHYGRWTLDPALGWAWVPGSVWSPAWVAWRGGADVTGWAPLPPSVGWSAGVGLEFGDLDLGLAFYDPWWTFVPVESFCHPHVREVILAPERTRVVIHQTVIVQNNLVVVHGHPVNHAVDVQAVERASGRPVPHVVLRDVDRAEAARTAATGVDEVPLYRPHVRAERVARAEAGAPETAPSAPGATRAPNAISRGVPRRAEHRPIPAPHASDRPARHRPHPQPVRPERTVKTRHP